MNNQNPFPARPDLCAVSVIIGAFNGAEFIMEQLDALAGQKFDLTWEVVVGENGSTDATLELLKTAQETFPVPLIIADASSRRGVSHARNTAVLASHGTILVFCDCDDHVGVGWVSAAWKAAPTASLVAGYDFELTAPFTPNSRIINDRGIYHGLFGPAALGRNFACSRKVFFEAGGFDESLPPYGCEDMDFNARLNALEHSHAAAPEMRLYFRSTNSARITIKKTFVSAKAESLLWQRFGTTDELPRTLAGAVRSIPAFLGELTRSRLAGHRFPPPKKIAREFVRRLGHVSAQIDYLRHGVPEPRLLSINDDPMRGTLAYTFPGDKPTPRADREHPAA